MRFKNLEEPFYPHGFGAIWKWMVADKIRSRRREAPRRVIVARAEPDLALIRSGAPSLTWVGHATWLVRLGGRSVVIDPIWSDSIGGVVPRNAAPGIKLDDAAPDVVLVTHNHRDHLDAPTIDAIGDRATYVVPSGLGAFFRKRGLTQVHELAWWEEFAVGELHVTFVPSQHWSRRGLFDANETLWGGFVLAGDGKRVYHSGDTAYFSGFAEIGRRVGAIDVAMLPIGAYDPEWFMRRQHMNPDDAMRAFLDLGARVLAAMHWGTFKLTDEPLDEPPELLRQAQAREQVAEEQVWLAKIGETRAL